MSFSGEAGRERANDITAAVKGALKARVLQERGEMGAQEADEAVESFIRDIRNALIPFEEADVKERPRVIHFAFRPELAYCGLSAKGFISGNKSKVNCPECLSLAEG